MYCRYSDTQVREFACRCLQDMPTDELIDFLPQLIQVIYTSFCLDVAYLLSLRRQKETVHYYTYLCCEIEYSTIMIVKNIIIIALS